MVAILRQLKVEKNGAVVDAMTEMGIQYPMSYGVSVPTIRRIAKTYAPDHEFGKYLYKQEIRELRLAALSISEAEEITENEIEFWAQGVVNSEVAEQLAALLLSNSNVAEQLLGLWLNSDNVWLRYAAMLSLARQQMLGEKPTQIDLDALFEQLLSVLDTADRNIWAGAARLIAALDRNHTNIRQRAESLLNKMSEKEYPATDYLKEELKTAWFEE